MNATRDIAIWLCSKKGKKRKKEKEEKSPRTRSFVRSLGIANYTRVKRMI